MSQSLRSRPQIVLGISDSFNSGAAILQNGRIAAAVERAWFQLEVWGAQDEVVMSATSRDDGGPALELAPGRHRLTIETRFPLREGEYLLELTLADATGRDVDRVQLPPRLLVLPCVERTLPPGRRGIVEEQVSFRVDGGDTARAAPPRELRR